MGAKASRQAEQARLGQVNLPRFGVEEEFLVVDADTRYVVARAEPVINRAKELLGERVSGEVTHQQVETRTAPCDTVMELLEQLVQARGIVGACAAAEGLSIVASGTPVLGGSIPPPLTDGPRQAKGTMIFRGLHDELSICALHVHVEMPDRERALMVSNHLRPYLPVLITLAANSPYWSGRDTGYASWRTMTWPRWPVAGPPPYFTSLAHYNELVETLNSAGALVDTGTIFWDIRPSSSHPTLEVRICDIPITAAESALFAALVRALVVRVTAAVDRGEPGPSVPAELLRVAYWRAARDGLNGAGLDVLTGRLMPATDLAERLLARALPGLDHTERDTVAGWMHQLMMGGTGSARQRDAMQQRGQLTDVVDYLARHTVARHTVARHTVARNLAAAD